MQHYSLVTLVTGGSCRAAAAGQALLAPLLGEEAVGTAVALWPRVADQAAALPRRAVTPGAAHRAAVAQVSCKGNRNRAMESHNCRMVWVGWGLKAHLIPTSLPWAGQFPGWSAPLHSEQTLERVFCHFAMSCFAEVLS